MSKIVERTLDLLELFGEQKRPLSLSDIARLLKIPVSSCHDVLQAMQARGYLYELAPRAGYYPTLRLLTLGRAISDHDPVLARAELMLKSLRDALDESVMLAKVNGLTATYLITVEASHPLRFMVNAGDNIRSLTSTSTGKALLGSLDDRDLTQVLRTAQMVRLTANSLTTREALRADIELGRKRKWFLNAGESLDGVTTLAASFRWNTAVYIVTIAGPSQRLDAKIEPASALLVNVCQLLEMRPDNAPMPAIATN
jgi:DNA-binding IclR family transcriptional regulator